MSTAQDERNTAAESASTEGNSGNSESWLNAPNIITLSRMVLAVVLFAMISRGGQWIAATAVFLIAAATDALDGFIARRYGLVTRLGRILDPFVDKFIICGAFVFLLEKPASGVTAWMVIVILGREMLITNVRAFLEEQGVDFSAKWSGKLKMVLQCVAVCLSLFSLSPDVTSATTHTVRDITLWSAVLITAYSGIEYCYRAIRILRSANSEA